MNDERVNIKIPERGKPQALTTVTSVVKNLDTILAKGHGGGNWRRIVNELKALYEQIDRDFATSETAVHMMELPDDQFTKVKGIKHTVEEKQND